MTIITGSEYRANQGKYIDMAHRGENVYIKTRRGNVILTPVADNIEEDEALFQEYIKSSSFITSAEKAELEHKEGKTLRFDSASDAQKWMENL